ncbi:hypothetical protein sync_1062 [Synechococcus sp. CC9311]|nr:hypothetical protein sync_1062 [Synechococcus sp. CC9311]
MIQLWRSIDVDVVGHKFGSSADQSRLGLNGYALRKTSHDEKWVFVVIN